MRSNDNLSDVLKEEINTLKQIKNKIKNKKYGSSINKFSNESMNESNLVVNEYRKSESVNLDSINIGKSITKENYCVYNSLNDITRFENEKIKQEIITLKSDNLIFREDVNHLTEVNKKLEFELSSTRNKNLEYIKENETLVRELLQKRVEVEKLTEAIAKLKLYDNPELQLALEYRHMKDFKIKQLELEVKQIVEDKHKIEIENRINLERLNEMKSKFNDKTNELSVIKQRESEQINFLETKIEKLSEELEFISKENKYIRLTDEKCRIEINNLNKLKEKCESKYRKKKEKVSDLKTKLSELENVNKMKIYENFEHADKKKEEDNKVKLELKQKIVDEMQNRISSYKREVQKQREQQRILNNKFV